MKSLSDVRSSFLDFFAAQRPHRGAVLAAGAAQRSHPAVHQCGHGAVQEPLHRRGKAALRARHHGAEMRARRRQAQRSRQCRLYRPPSHLLRDAGQFLLRRLFQGRRDHLRLGISHQAIWACPRTSCWSRSMPTTTRLSALWEKIAGLPDRQDHPHRHQRQFLVDGRYRSLRPLLGNLLRPWRQRVRAARPARPRKMATASSNSGIWSSCSSSRWTRRPGSICPSPRSTPAWGWSASPPCCRASPAISRPICSAI